MITGAGRFVRFRERASDHDRVRAAGERFADIAALAHSAVGNDRDIARGLFEVSIASCCAINRRGDLRYAQAEHAARSASRAGTDTNQHRRRPALHDLKGNVVADRVPDDDRNAHLATKFFQVERFIFRRKVTHGGDGALDDEHVRAGVLRDASELFGLLRNRTDGSDRSVVFDLFDAGGN
jgi:hypothetical protein